MLKRTLFTTFLFLVVVHSNAQENIVKASAITGNTGVQYERALGKHFSVIGQVGFSNLNTSVNDVETKSKGLGLFVEGRYYFSSKKERMEGWHIGVFYSDINTETSDNLTTKISSLGIGMGHQWVFDSNITLGLVFGGGTFDLESEQNLGILLEGLTFWPHLGLNLGYRF